METKGPTRQLAAIMFTDIVGYTALMGKDSAKALELIRISKEIQKPLVEKHNGKWLKEMGDGAMAQFSTALDAVNCSIAIQKTARGELDAKLRIGIHLGDVTVEEDDVHGDGVNVASRLESIADAGGIYISDNIEKAIQGQSNVQAKYLGEVKLKNVAYGVRTYALQGVGLPIPEVKDEKEVSGRFLAEMQRRGVVRAGATYVVLSVLLILLVPYARSIINLPEWSTTSLLIVLIIGLPIALYLAWNYERSPEGFVRTSSKESWQNPYTAGQRKPLTTNFIIAGMALIIVVMYLYPRYLSSEAGTEVTVDDRSIAVLPFKSLSEDPEKQYLADGVMDAILLHLSKIEDLRVITRTSVEKYRNPTQTIHEIADELQVNYILEGSFQKYGDQVRLIVQLSNAEEKEDHLWANEYNRDWSDIFSVQSEVAQTIAIELHAAITPNARDIIETIPTTNLAAYDFYLRAREGQVDYWLNNEHQNDLEQAITLYHRVLQHDSSFAQAYSGLAMAYWDKHFWATYLDENFMDSVLILANKALSIDDQLEEAYYVRAIYYRTAKGDTKKALNDLDQALKINPNYAWAYWEKGNLNIWLINNYVEGLKNVHKAASLDHSSHLPSILRELSYAYQWIGFEDKSIYYTNEALKLDNDSAEYFLWLGQQEINKGNFRSAIELWKKSYADDSINHGAILDLMQTNILLENFEEAYKYSLKLIELVGSEKLRNLNSTHRIGHAFWLVGKQEEAKEYFNEQIRFCLESISLNRGWFAVSKAAYYDLAAVYAFLGENEKAYQNLDEFNKLSFFPMWWVALAKDDPLFNSIREEERFQQILQNMEAKNFKEHERVRMWLEEEELRSYLDR